MKKLILLLLCASAWGQTITGTITGTTPCIQINVYGKGSVGILIKNSGTAWSGTIQPQVIVENDPNGTASNSQVTPSTSSTAQSTITANGTYFASVAGATYFQLCPGTVTNTAAVALTPVPLAANRNAGTGSGSVTSVTFTGDGVVESSTPSSAVTTSGTVTAALANAAAGTVLGNATASAAAPTYTNQPALGVAGTSAGGIIYAGSSSGTLTVVGCFPQGACTGFGSSTINATFAKLSTGGNCAGVGTAANPSVVTCSSSAAGAFSCATAATGGTCQVNTTAVSANSEIIVTQVVDEGTRLSVTCNTASVLPATPLLLSKSAGASFTITLGTVTTNPGCFDYYIVN